MVQAPEKRQPFGRLARFAASSGLIAGCLAFAPAAHAALTLQFDYGANNGTGFWDATEGAARKAAMETAATAFSSMFSSHFSNTATILLSATASNDANSGTLASAGSIAYLGSTDGFTVIDLIRSKAQGGADLNGAQADGIVDVNFGQSWHLDLATQTPTGKYDFYSTIYHEFTHALGFSSTIAQDGSGYDIRQWGAFDQFLVDKDGNRVVNTSTFDLNQGIWDAASVGGNAAGSGHVAGMYFDGTFAKAANGGNAVALYSPSTWSNGSSVSHLDDDSVSLYGMMMNSSTLDGPSARDYSAIEVGMLRDLGYTAVLAVPEPESYAMLLAGLGLISAVARRRAARA